MPSTDPTPSWFGQLDGFEPNQLAARNALADAAKRGDWDAVFRLIGDDPGGANLWRPGGTSWFTPLHQAAWNRAPIDVVERLIAKGAWRSLRTAVGETAGTLAARRGYTELYEILTPRATAAIPGDTWAALDDNLKALVERRIRPHLTVALRTPTVEVLAEIPGKRLWFPIPGMYGGFSIRLVSRYLHVESWSRIVGGSGQIHVVTTEGITLVEEGFV